MPVSQKVFPCLRQNDGIVSEKIQQFSQTFEKTAELISKFLVSPLPSPHDRHDTLKPCHLELLALGQVLASPIVDYRPDMPTIAP